jgi:hypothetical protein
MLHQPTIEKLIHMRLQGMVDGLEAIEQAGTARDLSFEEKARAYCRSPVHLAAESGVSTKTKTSAAARECVRGGHRLPGAARNRQDDDSLIGAGIGLGRAARESFHHRSDRLREKLLGIGFGTQGMPRRVLGILQPGDDAVSRSGDGARRRQRAQSPDPFGADGCACGG